MANGRVLTGFSSPLVAKYACTSGTIAYSGCAVLARGVDVSISPETGSDEKFYADNQAAESAGGTFTGGTFSLTVDGLKDEARQMIYGLSTADSDGWTAYDDKATLPYLGFGFIARYMEAGVVSYVPYMLTKVTFDAEETSAATQEDTINFQTSSLSGQIFRADDTNHTWKYVGKEYTTEELALAALQAKLGVTASAS